MNEIYVLLFIITTLGIIKAWQKNKGKKNITEQKTRIFINAILFQRDYEKRYIRKQMLSLDDVEHTVFNLIPETDSFSLIEMENFNHFFIVLPKDTYYDNEYIQEYFSNNITFKCTFTIALGQVNLNLEQSKADKMELKK